MRIRSTDTATVTITVTEVNDTPDAINDSATVAEDSGATVITVLGNDSKGPANESSQTLTVTLVTDPAHGSTSTNGTTVSYTPDANYNGPDSFTYTVCDNGTTNTVADPLCDTATVTITVTEVNDAPVIQSVSASPASITENQSTTATVTFQDVDAGDTHTCAFTWGDGGTSSVPVAAGVTSCSSTHTYLDDKPSGTPSDIYTINVVVTDNGKTNGSPDPKSDSDTTAVTVGERRARDRVSGRSSRSTGPGHTDDGVRDLYGCRHPGHAFVPVLVGRPHLQHGRRQRWHVLRDPYIRMGRRLQRCRHRDG